MQNCVADYCDKWLTSFFSGTSLQEQGAEYVTHARDLSMRGSGRGGQTHSLHQEDRRPNQDIPHAMIPDRTENSRKCKSHLVVKGLRTGNSGFGLKPCFSLKDVLGENAQSRKLGASNWQFFLVT